MYVRTVHIHTACTMLCVYTHTCLCTMLIIELQCNDVEQDEEQDQGHSRYMYVRICTMSALVMAVGPTHIECPSPCPSLHLCGGVLIV